VAARGGFEAQKDLQAWTSTALSLDLPSELLDRAWRLRDL
jgi:hypothetical protein